MSGRRWQRASGCALQEDGVQTETLEADTCEPRRAAQEKKPTVMDSDTAGAAHQLPHVMCVCPPDLSTVRGS